VKIYQFPGLTGEGAVEVVAEELGDPPAFEIGRALGVEQAPDEQVRTSGEILQERAQHRWEIEREAAEEELKGLRADLDRLTEDVADEMGGDEAEAANSVILEVRDTSADIEATQQAIETSRVARELAEENLRNQEKRHEVGMATTKDLLDFQTQLTEARFTEVQARVRHAIALARWRRAQGHLLSHYQIMLEHQQRSTPWFARF